MRKVGFMYSNDNGATFSTSLEISCLQVDVYKITETDHTTAANRRKKEKRTSYINCDILMDMVDFDPSRTAAAEANWLALQNFCAAKLRRIYNADATNYPTFDEYDTFNSNTNTAYVNLLDMEVIKRRLDSYGANTQKARHMQLRLQTRDKA